MSPRLPNNGAPVAALLGAGFAMRAAGQMLAGGAPLARQSLEGCAVLLYCLGFGYALQSLSSGRYPVGLHAGAVSLAAGTLLVPLTGTTLIALALIAIGAGLLTVTMARIAGCAQSDFARFAVAVSAIGPVLFAAHAIAFPAGGSELPARFLRLGAAATMALPLLSAAYRALHADDTNRASRFARVLLGIGMVALPLVLVSSALVDDRLKYGLGPASDCFTVALIIGCVQAWRGRDVATVRGFGVVLASMLLGKAMGFYAFEGPLPAPAPLAGYDDPWRVSLRDFHIDLMVLGYTFLLWPSLVRLPIVAVAGCALTFALLTPALGAWSWLPSVAILAWTMAFWRGRTSA